MKNGDRPMSCDASSIEPTRISDIRPTATPAIASMITALRTVHALVALVVLVLVRRG